MEKASPESLMQEVKLVEESIRAREKRQIRQTATVGQVDLNIFPHAIPHGIVDSEQLYDFVKSTYGSEFDDSKVRDMLPPQVASEGLNPRLLLALAIQKKRFVEFVGGILALEGISRITTIERFGFGREQVSAVVTGSTDEAFLLCKNLCINLWKCSGVERRWDDIAPFAERVRYKSTTIVHLPFPLKDAFRGEVHNFINTSLLSDAGLGKRMGLREADDQRLETRFSEMRSVVHCREFNFVITVIDETTGEAEDNTLHFLIKGRRDANRFETLVTSELPISEHVQLVEAFVKNIADAEEA